MNLFYLDTNFLLRFYLNDNGRQYKIARGYFERAKVGQIELVICQPVIFEVSYVLSGFYKFSKEKVVEAVAAMINIPYLTIEDREVFQDALLLFLRDNHDLVDCFLYAKAKREEAEILSFDKDFKKVLK